MTPVEIIKGLTDHNRRLQMKNDEYLELAEKRANAELEYRKAAAKKTLEFRDAGHSISLIHTLLKGDDIVSELRFKYQVAQAVESACLQSIKDIRAGIDTYRSLLAWMKAEMQAQ